MAEQRSFLELAWQDKAKVTRREQFLAEMNAVIPWARFTALIAPHYPKAGNGRRPIGLETMLRIYFLQQWYDLSDPGAEEALYDSLAMQRFVGLTLGEDRVPDESTILQFRHLLERHRLTEALFAEVRALLEDRGLLVKRGTIVDSTLLAAPSSTKNAAKARDPEMRSTRKGNQWYFGMKVHAGADLAGVVHTLTTTDAAAADITEMPKLLHGAETVVYGDRAYWKAADREAYEARGIRYRVNKRGTKQRPLTKREEASNRSRSRVRARGEHLFLVWKRLWGFAKVRYRGLAKNTVRAYASVALANLYLMRRGLLPPGARPRLA